MYVEEISCKVFIYLSTSYEKLYQKPCANFQCNTYLFSETVVEFNDNKACKMAQVGNKPELRSS